MAIVHKDRSMFPHVSNHRPIEFSWERKDCTVRALATVLNLPYSECHAYLKECGRRDKHALTGTVNIYSDLGLQRVTAEGGQYLSTVNQWMRSGNLPTRCVVFTKGHVFAVIDGVIHDQLPHPAGCRKRVYRVMTV